jgi:integrase
VGVKLSKINPNHSSGDLPMGRRRSSDVTLPKNIQRVVNRHGREYFYYQPNRGTKNAGKRIPLGSDTSDPEFWQRLRDAKAVPANRERTFSALIAGWRQQNWGRLRQASRKSFNHFLNRLDAEAGDRVVANLTRHDIYLMLDGMSATPNSANYMLAVLRVLLEWGVQRGYRDDNPAIGVKRLKVEDRGHEPWPEDGYRFVITHAPTHLQRMAFLGRATGQRVSDLVRMRPADLAPDGIHLKIGKLRDKKYFVPLTAKQMTEIRSWAVRDLDFFITTPAGRRCSATYMNTLWNDWRDSRDAEPLRDLKTTIHGLRATKINDLRCAGTEDGAIADEIGMSSKMVARYLRFADKAASARASRDRREQKRIEFVNPVVDLKTRGS